MNPLILFLVGVALILLGTIWAALKVSSNAAREEEFIPGKTAVPKVSEVTR